MSDFKITPQMIFLATDGGLEIILKYYPQAADCVGNKKYFKIRSEGTASARLDKYDGLWWVKDFGDSGAAMHGIDVMIREDLRQLTFFEALKDLGEQYGLTEEGLKAKSQYEYEKLPHLEGSPVGNIDFETKEFDTGELQAIFSRRVWDRLSGLNRKTKDGALEAKGDDVAVRNALTLCKEYGLLSLKHYDLTGRDKQNNNNLVTHRFISTPGYPILMWEAGTWQKIYKPTERDKKYRFVIRGEKTRIMFGYAVAKRMLEALQDKEADSDEEGEESSTKKKTKLPEVIICSGGSDALNVAAMGYAVVWFDSEMFNLKSDEFAKLAGMADKIYYLPDIDSTGVREAVKTGMDYLNIHLIFLPNDLRKHYDLRGNACKDVRDFFRGHGQREFDICMKQSMPLRFWDEQIKMNKEGKPVMKYGRPVVEYRPNNELIYNFLYRNDFGRYKVKSEKGGETLVRKVGNVVQKVTFSEINEFVKEFLKSESVMRLVGYGYVDIRNAFHRSAQFSENSMQNVDFLSLDFKDTGKDFQFMFFENETWKITKDGIQPMKHDKVPVCAWEDEVITNRVKVLEPLFEIFENVDGEKDIRILRKDCHYLNFLINTSRIYWRKELEDLLDGYDDTYRLKYLQEHRYSIDGPLLSPKEIQEQKLVLISKLLSFGYLLHRHKDSSEAYAVWVMDHNMMQDVAGENDSNGGTGKSISYYLLARYMKNHLINGRDKNMLNNPHIMDGVTEHTDYLYVDDVMKGFDFDFFYGLITSFLPVNPKNNPIYTVPFSDSPKLAFTSNFPPVKNDKSTRRRMWFSTFSDYYHKNPNGEYREERLPKDDFGMTLFDDFNEEQWNLTHNLLAQCVQGWLKFGKIESDEGQIVKNILLQKMGPNMLAWADEFFHPDNGRLDTYVQRHVAFEDAKKKITNNLTPQGFLDRLRAWCQFKGYVFNPKHLLQKDGRIMKHVSVEEYRNGEIRVTEEKKTKECLYIKTKIESEDLVPGNSDEGMPF